MKIVRDEYKVARTAYKDGVHHFEIIGEDGKGTNLWITIEGDPADFGPRKRYTITVEEKK